MLGATPVQYIGRKVHTSFAAEDTGEETIWEGLVTAYDKALELFTVHFEADGADETYTHDALLADLVSGKSSAAQAAAAKPVKFNIGDRIEALWTDVAGQAFYPASVAAVHKGGRFYTVNWDDGDDRNKTQPAENLRVPLPAPTCTTQPFSCVTTVVPRGVRSSGTPPLDDPDAMDVIADAPAPSSSGAPTELRTASTLACASQNAALSLGTSMSAASETATIASASTESAEREQPSAAAATAAATAATTTTTVTTTTTSDKGPDSAADFLLAAAAAASQTAATNAGASTAEDISMQRPKPPVAVQHLNKPSRSCKRCKAGNNICRKRGQSGHLPPLAPGEVEEFLPSNVRRRPSKPTWTPTMWQAPQSSSLSPSAAAAAPGASSDLTLETAGTADKTGKAEPAGGSAASKSCKRCKAGYNICRKRGLPGHLALRPGEAPSPTAPSSAVSAQPPAAADGSSPRKKTAALTMFEAQDLEMQGLVELMEWGRTGLGDEQYGHARAKLWEVLEVEGWSKQNTSGSYGVRIDGAHCPDAYLVLIPGMEFADGVKRVNMFDSWTQVLLYLRETGWHGLTAKGAHGKHRGVTPRQQQALQAANATGAVAATPAALALAEDEVLAARGGAEAEEKMLVNALCRVEWGRQTMGDDVWGQARVRLWAQLEKEGWTKHQTSGTYGMKVTLGVIGDSYRLLVPGVELKESVKRVNLFDSWTHVTGFLRRNGWHGVDETPPDRPGGRSSSASKSSGGGGALVGVGEKKGGKKESSKAEQYARRSQGMLNSSCYSGVSWSNTSMKWHAYVTRPNSTSNQSIGYFDDEVEAAKARDAGTREVRGLSAFYNFPLPGEMGNTPEEMATVLDAHRERTVAKVLENVAQQIEADFAPAPPDGDGDGGGGSAAEEAGYNPRVGKRSKRARVKTARYEDEMEGIAAASNPRGGGTAATAAAAAAGRPLSTWRPLWARDQRDPSTGEAGMQERLPEPQVHAKWTGLSSLGGTTWVLAKYHGRRQHVGTISNRALAAAAQEAAHTQLRDRERGLYRKRGERDEVRRKRKLGATDPHALAKEVAMLELVKIGLSMGEQQVRVWA